MAQTQNYSTKTNFIPRKNASVDDVWTIALDIGYSGVKGMSPNMVYCFPSFAREFKGQMLNFGEASPDDIQYRDEEGQLWNVGRMAQDSLSTTDTNDSIRTLYSRNRYFSKMFKVIARTGIGIGMLDNEFGNPNGKKIMLQTGLPPTYLKFDYPYLKEALAGHHCFELKVGNNPWQKFEFDLFEDDIRVMAQPMGSLLSASISNDAKKVAEADKYLASNVMIFDAGFGTLDIYSVNGRKVEGSESYDDLGMKAILMLTSEKIYNKFKIDVPVHTMQKCLRDGYIKVSDRRRLSSRREDFAELLEEATREIWEKVLDRLSTSYNMDEYSYLLITGGTGAAWLDIVKDSLDIDGLKIITGSQNDNLSHIYSNVRGYYLHQVGRLAAAKKKK